MVRVAIGLFIALSIFAWSSVSRKSDWTDLAFVAGSTLAFSHAFLNISKFVAASSGAPHVFHS